MAQVSAVNLIIHKGLPFEETFFLSAEDGGGLNLTGGSAVAKLKKHPTASTSYSFSTTITVGNSSVKVSMGSSITSSLPRGRCVYDMIVTDQNGDIKKVVEGNAIVQETVSL